MLVALQGASIWKEVEVEGGTVRQVFIIDCRPRLRIKVTVLRTEVSGGGKGPHLGGSGKEDGPEVPMFSAREG